MPILYFLLATITVRGTELLPTTRGVCVALLTDPHLSRVKRRVRDDEHFAIDRTPRVPVMVMMTQPEIAQSFAAAQAAGISVRVLRYAREFVGRSEIHDYARSTFGRAVVFDALTQAGAPEVFWRGPRIMAFARDATIVGLTTGAAGAALYQVVNQPALLEYTGLPMAGAAVTAGVLSRSMWARTYRFARAVFEVDARVKLRNQDPDRAGRIADFFAGIKDRSSKPKRSWMFAMNTNAQMAELLVHPPAADADPREIANYGELLRRELRRPRIDPRDPDFSDWRMVIVELIHFEHPDTKQLHLILNVRVISPNESDQGRIRRRVIDDEGVQILGGVPAAAR